MEMSGKVIADLCIYILTWNVGTHSPNNISLDDALSLNGTICTNGQPMPDIYVIAFQEVNAKPLNQIAKVFQDDPWIFKIKEHLDDKGYIKITTEHMQGLLISMWSQPKHWTHMKLIETQTTMTGFGGLWGNKGAVSIRLSLYGTGVAFVAAHLAAHDEGLRERIVDFNQIVDNHHYKVTNYRTIFDHDFVFWFGDLNFRLTTDESAWDVRNVIEQGRWDELFQHDQLTIVRKTGNAFSLMQEEKPTFPPTFKFTENTSEYNIKRRPAWCDRILYRVQAIKYPYVTLGLKQLTYKSHPDYILSDHKPVSAEFRLTITADGRTDEEIYELTHSASNVPLASVTILLISFYLHFTSL